jgi:hypothetical protein
MENHWSCQDFRPGIWMNGDFKWIRDETYDFGRCLAIGDGGHVVCEAEGTFYVMRLDLGDD